MNEIEQLRRQISEIDAQLIELLALRQSVARKIGDFKKQSNLPVLDTTREALLREYHQQLSEQHQLAPQMVCKVFDILIEESRKVQKDEQ